MIHYLFSKVEIWSNDTLDMYLRIIFAITGKSSVLSWLKN